MLSINYTSFRLPFPHNSHCLKMDVKTALQIFLYQGMILIAVQAVKEDSTPFRSALFITQENKRLAGHVVNQFEAPSLMSCSHSCLRSAWCTSTNFKEPSEKNGKGTCKLNKHGAIDENTKPRDEQGVTFSVVQVKTDRQIYWKPNIADPPFNKDPAITNGVLSL